MQIAVIGAGIIGITTAYELAQDGHTVTVFERRSAAAEEGSFANAGVLAPGYVTPWASPGMASRAVSFLLRRHRPMRLGWPLSSHELAWLWHWWVACNPRTYPARRQQMQSLASYSCERLQQITGDLQLEYDHSSGYLVLLRSEKERALIQPSLQVLRDAGFSFQDLTPEQARVVEPALNPDTAFVGAISLPNDTVANCRQFALQLKEKARHLGVEFQFNTTVERFVPGNPACVFVAGEPAARTFDAVVLCASLGSVPLLRSVGVQLPLAAVYGHSISAALREPVDAPRSAIMDERYKITISRLGQRVRVAGGAQLGGRLGSKDHIAIQTLYRVLHDWFPGAAQISNTGIAVQEWKGARPMLPDGPPVLGPSGVEGLWLNLGHGSSGWALSCGSARALADMLQNKSPAVDVSGLNIQRFKNS